GGSPSSALDRDGRDRANHSGPRRNQSFLPLFMGTRQRHTRHRLSHRLVPERRGSETERPVVEVAGAAQVCAARSDPLKIRVARSPEASMRSAWLPTVFVTSIAALMCFPAAAQTDPPLWNKCTPPAGQPSVKLGDRSIQWTDVKAPGSTAIGLGSRVSAPAP